MQNFSIDGVGTMSGGQYDEVDIDGVVTCNGDIEAEVIKIDGVFKCHGKVKSASLKCNGTAEFDSAVIAKKLDIDGFVKMERIEADEIRCNGMIEAQGEVSADFVDANGFINAKEIVGDRIRINSRMGKIMYILPEKRSKINLIEATTIELRGVTAQTVNGKDIKIGPRCRIQAVDCSGTLSLHEKADVQTITGDYKMV